MVALLRLFFFFLFSYLSNYSFFFKFRNETSNGVEPIFQFIAKLLDPSISESAGLFVGELIIKIILKVFFSLIFSK